MQANLALWAPALALAAALGWASSASAQAPHLIPPPVRGLHERIAQSDVVAIASVTRVDAGRIAARPETALRGSPPAELELKRSPLRPPRLAAGDRVLLILRGDRTPYVLVDTPDEIVHLGSAGEAQALAAALAALIAAQNDSARLTAEYERWAAGESALLRQLGAEGTLALRYAAGAAASGGLAAPH